MITKYFLTWKRMVDQLTIETYSIYLAYKDPRVPWYAKILIACIIGYAFSPVDKLLKSIPVIGYLDHLILVPLLVIFAFRKMIPQAVFTDCRKKAHMVINQRKPNWVVGSIILVIWFLLSSLIIVSTIWIIKDWNMLLAHWFRWVTRMTLIPKSHAY